MKVPIIFIIFNRPHETKKVFDAIRMYKPETLLVVADGGGSSDVKAIIDTIDWPCKVLKNYSEVNMGCRKRVSSGLDWAFEQVEKAIILEDDCLPDQTFFTFCEELLEKYKDDQKVMHISGNFFQHANKNFHSNNSYYFSVLPHIWGWASWARAWKYYDVDIKKWPEIKGVLKNKLSPAVYEYWSRVWDQYYNNDIDSWDGQWSFTCMVQDGLCINPTRNLVTNIGFGPNARGSKDSSSIFANIPLEAMTFPLKHPERKINTAANAFIWRQNFGIDKKLIFRILRPFKNHFPKIYQKIKNNIKRVHAFKNWYIFIWPLNHIGSKSKVAIMRNGVKIAMRDVFSSDFSIAMELAPEDYYNSNYTKDPEVIADIGANIGIFTITMAKRFPNAKVLAIEPEESNYAQLLKNIELNNIENIVPIKALVGARSGTEKLYLSKFDSAHSMKPIENAKVQEVKSITLESLGKIDILKVDVEGAEYEIFKDYIPECSNIIMEVHGDGRELINKFKKSYAITNQKPIYKMKSLSQ